jgi:hypothetical protein
MSIEAMQQAIDVLEFLNGEVIHDGAVRINLDVEIAALKQAIAEHFEQPVTYEQTEPTAWQCVKTGMLTRSLVGFKDVSGWVPLYPLRVKK